MPLGPKLLHKLVKEQKLVVGLRERELVEPEGAGFDVSLRAVAEFKKDAKPGHLGIEERSTPETEIVKEYNSESSKKQTYVIKPGSFVLLSTNEWVNVPDDLVCLPYSRSTNWRSGLIFQANQVAPGYKGHLTFGLYNPGPSKYTIELGARFAHIQFERVEGGGSAYRGQWQGGRISAEKKEKQV